MALRISIGNVKSHLRDERENDNLISARASAYWDANREKSRDPSFWMAHPVCRAVINLRVSGSMHEWPLDWFKRVYSRVPFEYGVSWGCGLGPFERAAIQAAIVRQIDAFDISQESLRDAARMAEEEQITGINYRVGDFDNPQLDAGRYDIAFFHMSLHHVASLERLFRRLSLGLKPDAIFYVDEYIGPSRARWRTEDLALAQSVLDLLPAEARMKETIDLPIEVNDPSEAIRSDEIPQFLRQFCDVLAWRPYGGQILDLVMPCVRPGWITSETGSRAVQAIARIEDDALSRDERVTHHVVAVCRLKPLHRIIGALAGQVWQAVRRRAGTSPGRSG